MMTIDEQIKKSAEQKLLIEKAKEIAHTTILMLDYNRNTAKGLDKIIDKLKSEINENRNF